MADEETKTQDSEQTSKHKGTRGWGSNEFFKGLEEAVKMSSQGVKLEPGQGVISGGEREQQQEPSQPAQDVGQSQDDRQESSYDKRQPSQQSSHSSESSGDRSVENSSQGQPESTIPDPAEPKTSKDWKAIKSERDHWKTRAEQLELSLEEFKKKSPQEQLESAGTPEQVDQIKKERDELRNQLQQVAYERDPQIQQQYTQRAQQIFEQAKKAVGQEHAQKIEQALQAPPEQRDQVIDEISENLTNWRSHQLANAVSQLDHLATEWQQNVQQSQQNWQQLTEQQKQEQQRELERKKQTFQTTLQKWTDPDEGMPFFQKSGDPEQDKEVDQALSIAEKVYFDQLSEDEKARASGWAALAPSLLKQVTSKDERIAELEKELQQYRDSQPGMGDGGAPQSDGVQGVGKKQGESLAEYIPRLARQNPNSKFSRM